MLKELGIQGTPDWLYEESRSSGRHMNIGLHPHVIGQPFRIRSLGTS